MNDTSGTQKIARRMVSSDEPRLGSARLPPREFTSSNCNVLFQLYVRKFYNEVMGNDKAGNNDRTTHNIPPV